MASKQQYLHENRGVATEAVSGQTGVWKIRIISAGEGSSGFYPAEVLERDGKRAFPVGTKAFFNHPSYSESWERPERDVEKIAGVTVSEVEWDATDQSSYVNMKFGSKALPLIEEFHDSLGMSIYALAESEVGTIGEYTGDVITHLVPDVFNSIDVVTAAGANGAIISKVSESYKRAFVSKGTPALAEETAKPSTEGLKLDKELKEALDAMQVAIVTAVAEALKPKPVDPVKESDLAAEFELVAESGLPKEARAVVFKAVESGVSAAESIASQKQYVDAIKASLKAETEAADTAAGRVLEGAGKSDDYRIAGWN